MQEDRITALSTVRDIITIDYKRFSIHDNESLLMASEALSRIRAYLRDVENTRIELTKPLNDHIKSLNQRVHAIADPIKALDNDITQKIKDYRAALEILRAEEQKRLEVEAQTNLTENALIPEAIALIVPEQPKSVQTMNGKITFVKIRKWELEDINIVPREYLKTDDAKITAAIKAGIEIPGIRSWTEEVPQARR